MSPLLVKQRVGDGALVTQLFRSNEKLKSEKWTGWSVRGDGERKGHAEEKRTSTVS